MHQAADGVRAIRRAVRGAGGATSDAAAYLDAIFLKLRPTDEPAEGVPVARGLPLEGQKVLLGLRSAGLPPSDVRANFGSPDEMT